MSDITATPADFDRIYAAMETAWEEADRTGDDDVILAALEAAELFYGREALRALLTGKAPRAAS